MLSSRKQRLIHELDALEPAGAGGAAARSGPRFGPHSFLLLAGYENLAAPNAIMQS
jgi:hypothetical protein